VLTVVGAGAAELLAAELVELLELPEAVAVAVLEELPVALPPTGPKAAGFCVLEHPASSRQAPNAPMRPLYTLPCFMSTIPAIPLVVFTSRP
jgi:hypothetical protein